MSEPLTPPAPEAQPERYKTLIVVLIMITTIITSIVASLQADANIRANNANRDSQYYAILISSELLRSGLQSTYDINTLATHTRETQESLVMQITALDMKADGNKEGEAISDLFALAAQSRADKLKAFSIFYSDPRYAPTTEDGLPNAANYLADMEAQMTELSAVQIAASEDYHTWSSKSDGYVGVLTIIAVAFFLFGLAQALTGKIRLMFAILGLAVLITSSAWAGLIFLL